MSYQVFARKYRPKTFDDVLGQDHVVRTLRNAIAQNRIAHAYLFVGPRGTGKTSTARILAKALNCPGGPKMDFDPDDPVCIEIAEGRSMDVLEIDGASNNGIDQVRDLRDTVRFAPMSGQFRIIYIDEVHMLSVAAFNGLLKVLEEPPPHAKFIFATTDPQKILPTIISRCQRFDLRRIPDTIIADHLLHIAELEKISLAPAAAHAVARGAEGGMRDAQSMLDQLVAFCGDSINEEDVLNIFGFTAQETITALAQAVLNKETAVALDQLHAQADRGKDLTRLLADVIGHFRSLLVHKIDPGAARDVSPALLETLNAQGPLLSTERLIHLIDLFADVDARMKWAPNKRLYFEIGLIKAIHSLEEVLLSDVIATLGGVRSEGGMRNAECGVRSDAGGALSAGAAIPGATASMPAKTEASPSGQPAPEATNPQSAIRNPQSENSEFRTPNSELPHNGSALWARVIAELQAAKPIQAGFASQGVFLERRGAEIVIGFAPSGQMAKDSLNRPPAKAAVEDVLQALSGEALILKLETREDITPPPPPPPKPELPPRPEPAARTVPASAPVEPAAPPPAEEEPIPSVSEEEFYNDPLIAEALAIFEAKITSITPQKKSGSP